MKVDRRAFAPICLSVLFSGRCDHVCSYCFAAGATGSVRCAEPRAIAAAARLVASEAARTGTDLVAGLNGGAEPLAAIESCRDAVATVRAVGTEAGLPVRIGLTTAGTRESVVNDWLAAEVDVATVSVDGRREVHDAHRRRRDGTSSWPGAMTTLDRLAAGRRGSLTVRMTVTEDSAATLPADVAWLAERFAPDSVVVEPVYRTGATRGSGAVAPSPAVLSSVLAATRHVAETSGLVLVTPEVRPGADNTRFCPLLQEVLALTPDGHATACLLALGDRPGDRRRFFGRYDQHADRFAFDGPRRAALLEQLLTPWPQCRDCAIDGACARGCPEACPLELDATPDCSRLLAQASPDLQGCHHLDAHPDLPA